MQYKSRPRGPFARYREKNTHIYARPMTTRCARERRGGVSVGGGLSDVLNQPERNRSVLLELKGKQTTDDDDDPVAGRRPNARSENPTF